MYSLPCAMASLATDPRPFVDDHHSPANSAQLEELLDTVAAHIIRLYRCEMDLLSNADALLDDNYFQDGFHQTHDLDETVYAAAMTLASISDCELDLATRIVDSVVDKSLPPWPSRGIACFVLMNFGLIRRGFIESKQCVYPEFVGLRV